MHAWRGRIGLVKPSHRGKSFAYWYRDIAAGVEIVPTFIGFRSAERREPFLDSFARAEELILDLKAVGCDLASVSGTPPFLLKGIEWVRRWRDELTARAGITVLTPMEGHAAALRALGAVRVAAATYYGEDLNRALIEYLRALGIEAVLLGGFSLRGTTEGLYATPFMALDDADPDDVYQYCKAGFQRLSPRPDALYINGGGWDVAPVVEALERDLRTRVVWALAADKWAAYSRLSIANPVPGCGRLLSEWPEVPEGMG